VLRGAIEPCLEHAFARHAELGVPWTGARLGVRATLNVNQPSAYATVEAGCWAMVTPWTVRVGADS